MPGSCKGSVLIVLIALTEGIVQVNVLYMNAWIETTCVDQLTVQSTNKEGNVLSLLLAMCIAYGYTYIEKECIYYNLDIQQLNSTT